MFNKAMLLAGKTKIPMLTVVNEIVDDIIVKTKQLTQYSPKYNDVVSGGEEVFPIDSLYEADGIPIGVSFVEVGVQIDTENLVMVASASYVHWFDVED